MCMDELEISGKRYISTRRAAKEHKYHSDYIGQLIRAGKVQGQKVGRSWYVGADSLTAYFGKEAPERVSAIREVAEEVSAPVQQIKVEISEVVAEAVATEEPEEIKKEEKVLDTEERHIPVKINKPAPVQKEVPEIKVTRSSLRYLADDGPLYPRMESRVQLMPRAVERIVTEEVVYVEEEPVTIIERPRRTKNNIRVLAVRGGVVLAAGVITLGIVVAASAFIVSTTTVRGETASVTYSLGGMQ